MLLNKFSQTVAEAAESSKISTPDAKKGFAALLEKAEQLKKEGLPGSSKEEL